MPDVMAPLPYYPGISVSPDAVVVCPCPGMRARLDAEADTIVVPPSAWDDSTEPAARDADIYETAAATMIGVFRSLSPADTDRVRRIMVCPSGGAGAAYRAGIDLAATARLSGQTRERVLRRSALTASDMRAIAETADPEVIAYAAERCAAWPLLLGARLDRSRKHGDLHTCRVSGIRARLLVVRCPSTGRRHVLTVPPTCKTAKAARTWTMHGLTPEVET